MTLRNDNRALAVPLIAFVAMLAVGALLFILFDAALAEMFAATTSQADTAHGTDQINQAEVIWNNILYFVAFVSVLFIITRAIVESRGAP